MRLRGILVLLLVTAGFFIPAAQLGISQGGTITISKACKDALEVVQDKLPPGRCWNWYMTHTYDLGKRYELTAITGATVAGPSEQKGKKFTWQLRLSEDGQKWFTDPKWVIEAEVGQKKSFGVDLSTKQGKGRFGRYVQIFAGPGIGKDTSCVSKNGCVDWSEIQALAVERLPLPDLVITDITWRPASPKPGEGVTVFVALKNERNPNCDPSPASFTQVTIRIPAINYEFGSAGGPLDSGKTQSFSFNSGRIAFSAEGQYQVTAIADSIGVVKECDENNNSLTKTIIVRMPRGDIRGRVLNHAGDPLPDAEITASGLSTRTDAQGRFLLQGLNEGSVAITAKYTCQLNNCVDEQTQDYFATKQCTVQAAQVTDCGDIEILGPESTRDTIFLSYHKPGSTFSITASSATPYNLAEKDPAGFSVPCPGGTEVEPVAGKARAHVECVSLTPIPAQRDTWAKIGHRFKVRAGITPPGRRRTATISVSYSWNGYLSAPFPLGSGRAEAWILGGYTAGTYTKELELQHWLKECIAGTCGIPYLTVEGEETRDLVELILFPDSYSIWLTLKTLAIAAAGSSITDFFNPGENRRAQLHAIVIQFQY